MNGWPCHLPGTPAALLATRRIRRLLGAALALAVIVTSGSADRDSGPGGLGCFGKVGKVHHPRCRLGSRLGHVPVRRVRGGSQGLVLEADSGLLLPRHPAEHHAQRNQDQGLDHRRQRQQPAGPAGERLDGPRQHRPSLQLPTGPNYTSWRISRSGSGYRLSYRTRSGSYLTKSTGLSTGTWSFSTPSKIVKVVLPSGSVRSYRGLWR